MRLFPDSPPVSPSEFAAVTNKEISQVIKKAVPEIHEEGDEVRGGSLTGKAFSF